MEMFFQGLFIIGTIGFLAAEGVCLWLQERRIRVLEEKSLYSWRRERR